VNSTERLQLYLQESIKKVTDKKFRRVSDCILETIPDFVRILHETILDPAVTRGERVLALSMLNSLIHRMELSKRPERKPRAAKPPELMTAEQFADLLKVHLPKIDDDTAENLRAVLAAANRRYHGG